MARPDISVSPPPKSYGKRSAFQVKIGDTEKRSEHGCPVSVQTRLRRVCFAIGMGLAVALGAGLALRDPITFSAVRMNLALGPLLPVDCRLTWSHRLARSCAFKATCRAQFEELVQ